MMANVISKEGRSRIMSSIRSTNNKSTERRLRAALASRGVKGWSVRPNGLDGKPDFVFEKKRTVVFVDGCFWHGCKKCRSIPSQNRGYWAPKLRRNKRRDRSVSAKLRRRGWKVIRLWEHELLDLERCILQITRKT